MSERKQIEIKLDKRKLTLMFVGSLIFVGAGIWFVINPSQFLSVWVRSKTKIFIVGIAGIIFFGFVGFFIFKKLFDKRLGLIINDDGILDNSSALAIGQILWKDISEIKVKKIYRQNFLMPIVNNPENYLNKQKNIIAQKAMLMNLRKYGSPISISANGLQCNFKELKNILDQKFAEFKTNKQVV